MKNPALWTKTDLHQHLQHALDLEVWTIPLYLTALYSIKGLENKKPDEYPDAAKLVLSVAIQEMLHVELVCNVCNALGYAPVFNLPQYNEAKGIPFIHPPKNQLPEILQGYSVKPGALNEATLKLFCAIELPHTIKENNWQEETAYDSIAQLYQALQLGISKFWDECFVGEKLNTKQKNAFTDYQQKAAHHHGFSQPVHSLETAHKAIDAIIEQGEGADEKQVPATYRPPELEAGKAFDPGWFDGNLSHYQKFSILLHNNDKLPPVYQEIPGHKNEEAQQALENSFKDFLNELQQSFNSNGSDLSDNVWKKMFAFTTQIIGLWKTGQCPGFAFEV